MLTERMRRDILLGGILAALAICLLPEYASAVAIGDVARRIVTNMSLLPRVVSATAYIGGAMLAVSGALKLKAHAEKPDQEKILPGITRLLVGGSLIALPALISTINTTTGISGSVTYVPLTI